MRKITKLLTLALAALMIMGAMPVSAAFADVSVDDAALYDAVELLTTLHVAKGTSETEFSPEALVTRQQMAAFVYRLMKAGRSSEGGVNTTKFADLEDSTFFNMISWASTAGIIKGTSATTFNPKGNITLQDAYVMVVRALGYEKDGALAYPFGYVDQAEAIGLDENIPSTVDYTDNLTRGQVAIILANAFYADMNEKTVGYKWVQEKEDGSGEAAYVAYEKAETIANKIFGVVEETLVVEATAHYAYDLDAADDADAEPTADENKDIDTLWGTRRDEDGKVVEGAREYKMDELKLEGSSDDYFLAEITLFVKKAKEAKDDEIIAAKSNLVKKTVTAADVVIDRSTKTDKEYYVDEDKKEAKVMTGLVTFGGIKAYLDTDVAPYSYKSLATEGNKPAVQFIDLVDGTYTEDFATFTFDDAVAANFEAVYYPAVKDEAGNVTTPAKTFAKNPGALTTAFANAYPTVYSSGLYEADVYDVNGDGYAEYVFVKDYSFFQVIDKKASTTLTAPDNAGELKVRDIKATVEGVEFADEDYVLAYINTDAKYIKVVEVIKPFTEMVTSTSDKERAKVATFADGTKIDFFRSEARFVGSDYSLANFAAGTTATVYAKNGIVLWKDGSTSSAKFDANANYAIVLEDTFGSDDRFVNGVRKNVYYVDAVIDGAVKTVQLADYAKVYNKYVATTEGNVTTVTATPVSKATSQKITTEEIAKAVVTNELANKFSTFTKTEDGAFTFTALNFVDAKDVTGDDIAEAFADTNDENAVYYGLRDDDSERNANIKHFSGSIYEVVSGSLTGVKRFYVKDYSKLIIKSYDEDADEDVYTVYDASNLSKFDGTDFTGVKAVFINNTKSNVENLGILFATVDEFASAETKDYRIVVEVTTVVDKDGEPEKVYTIIDLEGNKTEEVKAASESAEYEKDQIVVLDKAGEIKNVVAEDTMTAYLDNKLIARAFASYDDETKFLDVAGDDFTYVLGEDTTVLVYEAYDDYYTDVAEDLFNKNDEGFTYEAFEDAEGLGLYIIAEEDDDNDDIKYVKTLVIVPTFPEAE